MNLKFKVGINQRFGGFIAAIEEVVGDMVVTDWRTLKTCAISALLLLHVPTSYISIVLHLD